MWSHEVTHFKIYLYFSNVWGHCLHICIGKFSIAILLGILNKGENETICIF